MARYDYKCFDCGIEVEITRPMSEPATEPTCTCGKQMGQVYGSVGVQFKGSGFYSTDNK